MRGCKNRSCVGGKKPSQNENLLIVLGTYKIWTQWRHELTESKYYSPYTRGTAPVLQWIIVVDEQKEDVTWSCNLYFMYDGFGCFSMCMSHTVAVCFLYCMRSVFSTVMFHLHLIFNFSRYVYLFEFCMQHFTATDRRINTLNIYKICRYVRNRNYFYSLQ